MDHYIQTILIHQLVNSLLDLCFPNEGVFHFNMLFFKFMDYFVFNALLALQFLLFILI